MNHICRDIFKAIHENKWVSIEYKNREEDITKYWIGIKQIRVQDKSLIVEGLHLSKYISQQLKIFIDSIVSSSVIDGSYFDVPEELKENLSLIRICINPFFKMLQILEY